jgi:beta-barrel assembly-enhancing protease
VILLASLWLAIAAPVASAPDIAAYHALVEQDLRLANIGYRLATANAPFCQQKARSPGWVLHDEQQYPDRNVAAAAFQFRQPISIAAMVAGGPADKAGMRSGDGLISINGDVWVWHDSSQSRASGRRLDAVQDDVDRQLADDGAVVITADTRAGIRVFKLDPPAVCASRFWVDVRDRLDAGADGTKVRVTLGLMVFAPDDNELAAAVAHEFAHNILGHRAGLAGVKRGRTRAILATEIEADRLSVWLMANAGYDPAAALRFAERYGRKEGHGILSDGTHLRWKNRVKTMQAEIDLMARTQRREGRLPPPLLPVK